MAGYGAGSLTVKPNGGKVPETDMNLMMGAAGLRGVALEASADGGLVLAVTTDTMAVGTTSARVSSPKGNLAAAEAEVTLALCQGPVSKLHITNILMRLIEEPRPAPLPPPLALKLVCQ